jgi:threonine/homoserine/homoserine lactone efflux protein
MNEIYYLITGLVLGITAGIVPGPLMALLISETLKGNFRNGVLIAITPIITDIPLIILLLFFYKQVLDLNTLIKITSFLGSLALFYYGFKDLFLNKPHINLNENTTKTLKKGIIVNVLNPHAYIFWGLIGVPQILKGSFLEGILFLISFFTGISSTMLLIAFITAKSKEFLESKYYIFMIKFSGFTLILFGFYFLYSVFKQ